MTVPLQRGGRVAVEGRASQDQPDLRSKAFPTG